ncbi:hypothetical protein OCC_07109 [Thermococcus litoralis DSM 5473]|uniref:Uncharacterized protein n=1 Tax=Thermococcus litoralis (strain ATCC 51850 / DSM 5473 / JCM 8560 / NS-C) TaxID=523849 RepID=H3ZMA1_THELN|nr:hypothetical protein [Thermococcus litoralis]EHR78886.1 hypothetical protein OCC_07109 [Thermococcus litoralis DSM 5473]
MRLPWLILVLVVVVAGCLEMNETSKSTQSSSLESSFSCPVVHPGYGEFNANNLLFEKLDGKVLQTPAFLMPPNATIRIRGKLFAKEYKVGNITCYYAGKVKIKAFLGTPSMSGSWSHMAENLRDIENISVEITPRELFISPEKNATFEVEINTKNTHVGQNYYVYIVAFGESGWKSWGRIEIKIWGSEKSSH